MTREELIKKTEQFCDLYLELKEEGVYGIMLSMREDPMGKVRIQCERRTLEKYAGGSLIETRARDPKFSYPSESIVRLDKFEAFALNDPEQG